MTPQPWEASERFARQHLPDLWGVELGEQTGSAAVGCPESLTLSHLINRSLATTIIEARRVADPAPN